MNEKLNSMLIHRVKKWNRFDTKKMCSVTGCMTWGMETDSGDFCFHHYTQRPSCSVDGCNDPIACSHPLVNLCRKHFVVRSESVNEKYLKSSRESALYSGNSTLATMEENAVGSIRDIKTYRDARNKKIKQKKEEQKNKELKNEGQKNNIQTL